MVVAAVAPEINQVLKQLSLFRSSRLQCLLTWLLRACRVFGAAPWPPGVGGGGGGGGGMTAATAKLLHRVWLALLLLYICVVNYMQSKRIPAEKPTAEKALYVTVFVTNCAIVALTVVGSQCSGERFSSVPRQLMHLARELHASGRTRSHDHPASWTPTPALDSHAVYRDLRNLTVLIAGFLAGCFVLNLLLVDFDVLATLRSSGAYNVPQVLISLNLGQHWWTLRLINQLYGGINECLCRLLPSFEAATQPWNTRGYLEEQASWFRREFQSFRTQAAAQELLDKLRHIYAQLDALTSSLAGAFGLVLLLNFLATFIELSIELFSIYKYCDQPYDFDSVLVTYKVMWIVLHVGRVFFILLPHHAIIAERCRTCFTLYRLNSSGLEMERAINRFLTQLMVHNKAESACGIVNLDLTLLGGITSALSMFIIFLIQIDFGVESLADDALNKTLKIP